eukprot:Trichotokara_eunicae@DN9638_c0_g1_i1.p1
MCHVLELLSMTIEAVKLTKGKAVIHGLDEKMSLAFDKLVTEGSPGNDPEYDNLRDLLSRTGRQGLGFPVLFILAFFSMNVTLNNPSAQKFLATSPLGVGKFNHWYHVDMQKRTIIQCANQNKKTLSCILQMASDALHDKFQPWLAVCLLHKDIKGSRPVDDASLDVAYFRQHCDRPHSQMTAISSTSRKLGKTRISGFLYIL